MQKSISSLLKYCRKNVEFLCGKIHHFDILSPDVLFCMSFWLNHVFKDFLQQFLSWANDLGSLGGGLSNCSVGVVILRPSVRCLTDVFEVFKLAVVFQH